MTALLTRWQVIPADSVVLCNRANFWNPSGSYATEGNNEWMNEYDLSDAITETVAGALNKIKF